MPPRPSSVAANGSPASPADDQRNRSMPAKQPRQATPPSNSESSKENAQNTWLRLKPSSRPRHGYHPLAETRFIFSLSGHPIPQA
jgi:hypothetical protein